MTMAAIAAATTASVGFVCCELLMARVCGDLLLLLVLVLMLVLLRDMRFPLTTKAAAVGADTAAADTHAAVAILMVLCLVCAGGRGERA